MAEKDPRDLGHPSVHSPDLAGHVGGAVGREETDDSGDLLGLAEAGQRNAAQELPAWLIFQVRDDLRVHEGATALTVMPCVAISSARALVKAIRPPLAAE